jgi:hypothetical protein
MEMSNFKIYASLCACTSIIFSFGLILSMRTMTSNYAKIMRHIVIGECIFIFCELMVLIDSETDSYNQLLCTILDFVLFHAFDEENCSLIKRTNYAGYFALQTYSIWLNIFMCCEMIMILKNPIAQMKNRFTRYYLSSIAIGLVVFAITLPYTPDIYTKRSIIGIANIPM